MASNSILVVSSQASKLQLEQAQRERRAHQRGEHRPLWFRRRADADAEAGECEWLFTGAYWEMRQQNKLPHCGAVRLW